MGFRVTFHLQLAQHIRTNARNKSSLSAIHDGLRRSAHVEVRDSAPGFRGQSRSGQDVSSLDSRARGASYAHHEQMTRVSQSTNRPSRDFKGARSRSLRDIEQRRSGSRNSSTRYDDRPPTVLSITYTTAASQFLYGTSVVQAALSARSRRLYRLYIKTKSRGLPKEAGGDPEGERVSLVKLRQLAISAGVKVSEVGDEFIEVMDKLSQGRPHNVSTYPTRVGRLIITF
jgi:hypothetical protein